MDFVVIDVETANQSPSSICQIGVASFSKGRLVHAWGTLVNPEDWFLPFNVQLHGIRPCDVVQAPTWIDLQSELRNRLERHILASHTYFDRGAMNGANERYGLKPISVAGWIDTCQIARTAWPSLPNHKLTSLSRTFGIAYEAHDAAEDARCAGEILILAVRSTGLSLDELSGGTRVRAGLARYPIRKSALL